MTDANNYRPISTLSPFSKILERLVYDQLISFINKNNILYKYQFGFRKGFSTEHAILELTDYLRNAIDNKQYTCGIFLDFSKAFDTVNHSILLNKLEKYGIRGLPLQWFYSYLSDRAQFVQINNTKSDKLMMKCGIPQGSTLGPLLFLIYINDLANSSDILKFRIFADDTNIFYSSKNLDELQNVINNELSKVYTYCIANKLSINFTKTNYMIITTAQRKDAQINIANITQKNCIKYLGVYIDKHLNWKSHLSYISNKIAKNIGILFKIRRYLSLKMLTSFYYSLIFPYINYGIMSWGAIYKTSITKLSSQLRKCVRCIFFLNRHSDPSPYFKLLGILQIENIYKLRVVLFTHQILNKSMTSYGIFSDSIVPITAVHHYNTRFASSNNLYRHQIRTNYGKFTYKYTSSKVWETVPYSFKCLPYTSLKRMYKEYLINNNQ